VKKKSTEITFEVDEVIQVSSYSKAFARRWCAACGSYTAMATPQQAALITSLSVSTINHSVESHTIHSMETDEGLLLVCVNTLRRIASSS
jgi:hypothetical protein